MGTLKKVMESNGKCLTLFPTDESKDTLKKQEELWSKIRDVTWSTTNTLDNYHDMYVKIKFNSDDDLTLKKTLKLHNLIIVVRSVFHWAFQMNICINHKCQNMKVLMCPKELGKQNRWFVQVYFLDKNFRFDPKVCNGCHILMEKAMNFNVSVDGNDYRTHFFIY